MTTRKGFALFLDPGLGKTAITLAAFKRLRDAGLVSKGLLIAPLRVARTTWPAEVSKWDIFHDMTVQVLHGKHKEVGLNTPADIYAINPEGLEWLLGAKKTKSAVTGKTRVTIDERKMKALGFDVLIIDELSKFKSTDALRFKMLKPLLPSFKFRWGLTGSPAANGLEGLFAEIFMLDMGASLGKFISNYRALYFIPSFDGFGYTLRKGAEEEIYDAISDVCLRLSAEDYLDMPAVVNNIIPVVLPPAARKAYLGLELEMFTELGSSTVTAASAAAVAGKCRQVANGGIYVDKVVEALTMLPGKRETVQIHTAKVDALADLVEELQGSPLLVAYEFEHDLARIRAKFGDDVPYIGSGVSPAKTTAIVDRWNRGEIPLLFGHPAAMGHGLNMQEAGNHVCWLSLTWDFELYDQFNRRVLRQGNKHHTVFVHHILAAGTIDDDIYDLLGQKNGTQQHLFAALKKRENSCK